MNNIINNEYHRDYRKKNKKYVTWYRRNWNRWNRKSKKKPDALWLEKYKPDEAAEVFHT